MGPDSTLVGFRLQASGLRPQGWARRASRAFTDADAVRSATRPPLCGALSIRLLRRAAVAVLACPPWLSIEAPERPCLSGSFASTCLRGQSTRRSPGALKMGLERYNYRIDPSVRRRDANAEG